MSAEPAYPLSWPVGWPRETCRQHSRFGTKQKNYCGLAPISMAVALDFVEGELARLGGQRHVISCNVPARLDGRPKANTGMHFDPGMAIYFTLRARRTVLACDRWFRPEDNLYAIAKHIEAMRGQDRWGVGSVEQAFAGYAALNHRTGPSCWEVLGLDPNARHSEEMILAAFRAKAKAAHPDQPGGSHDAFADLSHSKDIALATIRTRTP